ncbi:MAG: hypothetical protein FWG50_12930 [Kiritimatiellaeota bacterium]|nr:hypothetical protein [Kiritimatiellota bacterium]
MINWNSTEAPALVALQRGIPITAAPFADLAATCGTDEAALIALAQALLDSGEARRFGAVFDARRLGYRSALCAIQVPPADLARVASIVAAVPGVTHAYERGRPPWPNLWFTLAAPADTFDRTLDALRADCAPYAIDELPALRRFKIDVIFDARTRDRDERTEYPISNTEHPTPKGGFKTDSPMSLPQSASNLDIGHSVLDIGHSPPPPPPALHTPHSTPNTSQHAIIRLLQGDIPLSPRPFAAAAGRLGMGEDALLSQLREWQASGILRRIGLLLRHREAGFKANGMCCWDIPEGEILAAGRRVAAQPEVTHCYERPRTGRFPFTLYAMIHTPTWDATRALFERITRDAALPPGELLLSLTEFKKTSMRFFD